MTDRKESALLGCFSCKGSEQRPKEEGHIGSIGVGTNKVEQRESYMVIAYTDQSVFLPTTNPALADLYSLVKMPRWARVDGMSGGGV